MPFHPCVDGDVLAARPVDVFVAGIGAEVDLLIDDADKMRLFLMEPTLADVQMCRGPTGTSAGTAPHRARLSGDVVGDDPMDVWAAIFSYRETPATPAVAMADAHQGNTFRLLVHVGGAPACHTAYPSWRAMPPTCRLTFGRGSDRLGWDTWTASDPRTGCGLPAPVGAMTAARGRASATGDPGGPRSGRAG